MSGDRSERRQKESELSRLNRTLRALSGSSEAMMRASSEAEYLEAVCGVIVDCCGYSMVWIGLVEEGEAKRVVPVAFAGFDEEYVKQVDVTWADTERGRGPVGTAIRTGKPTICDALTDPDFMPWRQEALKRGYASVLGLPLINNGRVLGAITIYSLETNQFSEEEVRLLVRLSDDLAYGITTLRLREGHARAEVALKHREKTLQTFFDAVHESMVLINTEGTVLLSNTSCGQKLGTTASELVGTCLYDRFPPDVARYRKEQFAKVAATGEPVCFEDERSGSYYESYGYPVVDENGTVTAIAIFAQEITERKQAEEALRESEEKFRLFFEKSAHPILLLDGDTFVGCNEAALSLMGCHSKEQLIGLHPWDLSPERQPDGRLSSEKGRELINETMRQGTNQFEWIHRTFDGEDLWIDVSLTRIPVHGKRIMHTVWRDITKRKQAEAQSRESEERYRVAIESSNDGVALSRGAGLIYANRRFLDMYGYDSLEEARHTDRFLRIHPDNREMVVEYTARRQRGEPAPSPYECKGIAKNGAVMHLEVSVSSVTYLGEPASLVYLRDITERKRAEDALRDSETKLRAIFDGSRDAIAVSKDGVHTLVNSACVSLFGYESADELMGVPLLDLIASESRGFVAEILKKRARGKPVPSFYEVTALKKDGTTFLMECTVSSYVLKEERFTLAILRDITDREEAQRQLEEKEERFRKIFEESLFGIVIVGSDHRFVKANASFCRMLGYKEQELTALTFEDITHPEHIAEDTLHVNELVSGEISLYRTEKRYLRKDKQIVWGSSTVTIVHSKDGGILYFLTMVEDITQRKQAEGERAALGAQLHQAQKMEAIGTLAGGVAHDFNNILTVIMGLGNLIQMSMDKDDVLRPHVDQIVASSERAADLTQSLLAFSRKQRITLEPHNVSGVVQSTAKLLKRLLPEDIGLTMNLVDEDATSLLDITQISQVLMNLATNARDAMPHGGSLTITTKRVKLDGNFKKIHGFGRPGEYVKLSVSDTGIGMDKRTMERIFEPFFTTKEVGKGTGLGLASAYGIVKQHKGYITVSSTFSKGATFDIYLPLINPPPQQEAPAAEEVKRGTETILIVEDDGDVRNMLTTILESKGYATIEAIDGDHAIRVYYEHREEVDLIILDVVMPGKNGKEVLDEIARTDPGVKAIFVSGYTGDIVIDKGIQSESADFLQKPLSATALLGKVREVLDR